LAPAKPGEVDITTKVKEYYKSNPLNVILIAALFLRLLAAFFSKGYAFHDDHFCVIRVAQNWASGFPHWLEMSEPPKHSMLYAGINSLFIWIMEGVGVTDPIFKTTVLRLFHAFYSLLTVYFAYKIVNLLSSERNAKLAGWITALIWFMPFLSVKFLAELVCVPLVLGGFYLMIKSNKEQQSKLLYWLLAGALFGLAFTIRLHTIIFAGGLGLVLLFRKQWVESVLFTLGYLVVVCLVVGVTDYVLFDYPFHSVVSYFEHNSENANKYVQGSPYKFTLTTLGFLVPPISLLLIFGYLRSFKVEPMMFVAAAIFFVFHSSFPNQQERFILPVLPIFIILGVIGWNSFLDKSSFWQKYKGLHSGFWKFFWTINIIAAIALALTFVKKDRVAPLHYLSSKPDVTSVIVENERSVKQVPAYYLGSHCVDYSQFGSKLLGMSEFKENKGYLDPEFKVIFTIGSKHSVKRLKKQMNSMGKEANYIVFQGETDLEKRIDRIKEIYPNSTFELIKIIEPSNFDKLLHFLNPRVHRNQTARIFRIKINS